MPLLPDNIRIRAPRVEEGQAVRMLISDAGGVKSNREHRVAVIDSPPFILGALSFAFSHVSLAHIRLRVIRTHRRIGIGSLLVSECVRVARERKGEFLHALADSVGEPDAAAFMDRMQFRLVNRMTTVEADLASGHKFLEPLAKRIGSSREGRIVPLREAPSQQVARLEVDELMRRPDWSAVPMAEQLADPAFAECPVVMVGDEVAGFLLWRKEGEIAHVPARVVDPRWRGGWVNAMMTAYAVADSIRKGCVRTRWDIPDGNSDTAKLARRFGGVVIRTHDVYVRRLSE